jgi:Gram-negative bacterial TonB protein C-terminal
MSAHGKAALIASLALLASLTACSSTPAGDDAVAASHRFNPVTDPYWLDPQWDNALLDAAQAVVHDPVTETDMTTHGPHVTIKFTLANGAITEPAIIAGTGNPDLDDLLLKQVVTAQVPKPTGLQAGEPHGFLLDLDMLTPYEYFQNSVYAAIYQHRLYPKNALLHGTTGSATVDFDYLDGKANNIAIIKSSNSVDLDKSSIYAVTNATMPLVLTAYADKTLHMEVIVCYCLNSSKSCSDARNVILVEGTRVVTVTVQTYRP